MVLKIIYRGNIFLVSRAAPKLQLGRDDNNDVVVMSLFASRVHACIELREGGFFVNDQSTNGTFLMADDHSSEVQLTRAEASLAERGWLGIGRSAAQHGTHSVRYSTEEESD